MAGHYFYDPRPFYGHNSYTGLMPLDELFYGRYEPVPYWLDQRMAPVSMYEENFYAGQKQMVPVGRRGPEVMQQQYVPQRGENNFMAYKRPEVRDDIYMDMYRRSPYNFNYNYGRDNGVSVAPIGGGAMMHPRGQTQDDTWIHTMNAPGYGHSFPASRGLPEPPPGMPTRFSHGSGSGNGNEQYRMVANNNMSNNHPGGNYSSSNNNSSSNNRENMSNNHSRSMPIGNEQYRPMEMPANNNMSNNQAGGNHSSSSNNNNNNNNSNNRENMSSNHNSHGNKQMSTPGNNSGSFAAHGTSKCDNGQGGKSSSMTSKPVGGHNNGNGNTKQQQQQQQKRYNANDSSSSSDSEDDDDEYEHGRNNGGGKWTMVTSQHGHSGTAHGHRADSHGFESNSRGLKNNSASHSSSAKKSSSHLSHASTNSKLHGSTQSKISKLLRFQDRGHGNISSSEDDEMSYGHSKKGGHSSKGSSKGGLNQQHHGSGHGHGHGHSSHVPSFQSTYGSQAKQMQFSSQSRAVELKVPICCDNCERKVRACLEKMDGVESVLCDQWNRKVIVYGNLKADTVLKRVRRVKKASELWHQAKQQQLQFY